MNNRYLQAIVSYLLISVVPSAAALSTDHGPVAAARSSANASATVIGLEVQDCAELQMRTRSSMYVWGAPEAQARRPLSARCVPVEGQAAQLFVVYRDMNGSIVSVRVDDGAVSISPPPAGSGKLRSSVRDVQVVDILLNYD